VKFAQDSSPDDFSLYCDIPANSLFDGSLPEEFFPISANFNNFCILKYGNNVGIGTTLNGVELSQETLDSLGLEITEYSACTGTGDWQKCGSVWFNPSINGTIWLSSQPPSLAASNNPIKTLFDAIKVFFENILGAGKEVPHVGTGIVERMLASTNSFDTIYLAKAGSRQIFAAYFNKKYAEFAGVTQPYDSIAGDYQNLDFSFCDSLENYCPEGTCSYLCEPSGATSAGTFKIYHIGKSQTPMSGVWQALTSKLRLKSS
jgi:hypothetical protein